MLVEYLAEIILLFCTTSNLKNELVLPWRTKNRGRLHTDARASVTTSLSCCIVITYLRKEVYPQCVSFTWGLTLSYEMLPHLGKPI